MARCLRRRARLGCTVRLQSAPSPEPLLAMKKVIAAGCPARCSKTPVGAVERSCQQSRRVPANAPSS